VISYDTNVLIYALEVNHEFSELARMLVAEAESVGAVLSVLVRHEIYTGRALMNQDVDYAKEALDTLVGTKWLNVDDKIVYMAAMLTKKYGNRIKGYDAILVATAITGGAKVFYTNDKALYTQKLEEITIQPIKPLKIAATN
jgi:predicted nucleic acid-binding protein